uniref:Uncharacterized protein n=1 Tax=Arundo donax TaxID=35708 RepID=A0A0A9G4R0_ARUDO
MQVPSQILNWMEVRHQGCLLMSLLRETC